MTQAESLRLEPSSSLLAHFAHRVALTVLSTVALLLFATVLVLSSKEQGIFLNLLFAIGMVLGTVIVLHTRLLIEVRSQQRKICSNLESTTHDVRQKERQLAANCALARSASAEAEAIRTTTLTLTKNWQFDHVLDMLLGSLAELVPYESAHVLLVEDDARLFVARQKVRQEVPKQTEFPVTFDLVGFAFLRGILKKQSPIVLRDVNAETEWRDLFPSAHPRSWLCIPLIAADRTLGLLCAGHSGVNAFTPEHLRLAQSLAVSIAAAIQNARLYEQAQIYGVELEKRLSDLRLTQRALAQAEEQRLISEDRFQSVFRSSPVAFSITMLQDGRFLDVNPAFEQRYGFSRAELIDHAVFELRFWEDQADRAFMIAQLHNGNPVRNLITRLRTKSGEFRLTAYSASRIQFDGEGCVLAVSGDVPQTEARKMN